MAGKNQRVSVWDCWRGITGQIEKLAVFVSHTRSFDAKQIQKLDSHCARMHDEVLMAQRDATGVGMTTLQVSLE